MCGSATLAIVLSRTCMTVAAIMGGLLPIMWTTGTGADVMKRIAAPMIGGMVTSTILTLLVIPVLYALWRWREVKRRQRVSIETVNGSGKVKKAGG